MTPSTRLVLCSAGLFILNFLPVCPQRSVSKNFDTLLDETYVQDETRASSKQNILDDSKKNTLYAMGKLSSRSKKNKITDTSSRAKLAITPTTPTETKKDKKIKVIPAITPLAPTNLPANVTEPTFSFKQKDMELIIGGNAKIEHFFDHNAAMLNKNIPDEYEYFKHNALLNFDFNYRQEKFGYKAIEGRLGLRHKGVWGRSQSYSDRGSGSVEGTSVRIADAVTGTHTHSTGKNLPWINEAWLNVSLNAAVGAKQDSNLQFIKLGWFPFDLGRGIALGNSYGSNREILGLYYYDKEEKYAPGINLSGTIVKDILKYDLYYAKYEERNKSLSDAIDMVRTQWIGRSSTPWRGVNKDDEIIAARLKYTPIKPENNIRYGKIELEPYIFYNIGSDQYIEIEPDSSMKFGSYGLSAEYSKGNFECGAEVALNYGEEKLVAIDRNKIEIKKDTDGYLIEQYSHFMKQSDGNYINAQVTDATKAAATVGLNHKNGEIFAHNGTNYQNKGADETLVTPEVYYNTPLADNRLRPAFTNKLDGWMAVVDAAYNFSKYNLKVAAAYAYASGDANPHELEKNKTYHGFVGENEFYSGKRVPSVFLLGERLLKCPTSLTRNSDELISDLGFTDLHMPGFGVTWSPSIKNKKLSVNPNMLFYWKAKDSLKLVYTGAGTNDWEASKTGEKASKFMGTELNLVVEFEFLKNLKLYARGAVFMPGGFFKDLTGMPLDDDFFSKLLKVIDTSNPIAQNSKNFRLGHDTAYHLNIGLDYKF